MVADRKRKRLTRDRMARTGESYSVAARAIEAGEREAQAAIQRAHDEAHAEPQYDAEGRDRFNVLRLRGHGNAREIDEETNAD